MPRRTRNTRRGARAALQADPRMAEAAYNLGILLGKDRVDEAVQLCRKAYELRPENPKYGYTLAFYLNQKGDLAGAARVLQDTLFRQPGCGDAYKLLGEIYTRQGQKEKAAGMYLQALRSKSLPESDRARIGAKLQELAASKSQK